MFRNILLTIAGVISLSLSLSGVSCAPIQTAPEGGYGQTVPAQGPPPGDYTQPVIGQRATYRKEMAKECREAAYTFQRQGFIKQAVVKYRESLTWWPDPALDAYIESVEKTTGLPSSGARKKPWTSAPRPPSQKQEVVATIRNRSNHDVYVYAEGGSESPESRFLPGEIREVAVRTNAYGEVVFLAGTGKGGLPIATAAWTDDPEDRRIVPVVLFDDEAPRKLLIMTGFRSR